MASTLERNCVLVKKLLFATIRLMNRRVSSQHLRIIHQKWAIIANVTSTDLIVWVTAKTRPDEAIAWNEKHVPEGTEFRYLNDIEMETYVKEISEEMERTNLVNGCYKAWKSLKPWAYKSDIFRAMVLWRYGSLYMDHKVSWQRR